MLKQVSIEELKPGMYVECVIEQTGSLRIKSKGFIRSPKSITSLKRSGILTVTIDTDKTLAADNHSATKSSPPAGEQPPTIPTEAQPKIPIEKELKQANKLFQQAKSIQKQIFSDIKQQNQITIEPIENLTDKFIESIFRNQDALSCMTRIKEKDSYLLEHSINVSVLMTLFAKHLAFERDTIHQLAMGALLHDIGKIKIPDKVLNKPGRLTDEEFTVMKSHAAFSRKILENSPGIPPLTLEVAANHHERIDGSGYPRRLKGAKVSQFARMIAIIDAYDAMTSERCYKPGLNSIHAFKILKKDSHTHFDADLVDQFIQAIGIHPVGSLVQLKSHKLAIITESNSEAPLRPKVKTFYNAKHHHYIEIKDIDLASKWANDEIEASVKPENFNIDLMKFFREVLLN